MKRVVALVFFVVALCAVCYGTSRRIYTGFRLSEWAQRVVNNGGPTPSLTTINCMESLRATLIAQGITNKIHTLCIFVPDSIIAASTPLFKHRGSDPWANTNFVNGDLTIEGLKGDGLTKSLDTGLEAENGGAFDDALTGASVVVTESNSNRVEYAMGFTTPDAVAQLSLRVSSAGALTYIVGGLDANEVATTNDFVRVGYISANTMTNGAPGTTNSVIYVASELESHRLLFSEQTKDPDISASGNNTISVFAIKNDNTNTAWSGQRMSAALFHFPFTEVESSNVWVALRTCRECLGGGMGNPVKDWSRRVVEAGGAAISTTTSNALSTFWAGLSTDGIIDRVIAANAFVPDNLTAARLPLIVNAGSLTWTNNNFGATNLTVNGLTGDGSTKFLSTGINPSTVLARGFSVTSASVSVLTYTNPVNGVADFGGAAGTAFFYPRIDNGLVFYLCWRAVTVNTDYVIAPPVLTNGWTSGSRTAANAIALYQANSGIAHVRVTNATGNAAAAILNTNLLAFAATSIAGTSDHTVSFIGLTTGLTQTQNSNLWNRVRDMRTTIGGGVP